MLQLFAHAVERYGYLAVVTIVTAEGFGIPLPGETAVVTAAAFAATGSLSATGVALAATLGTVLGGSGGYWIGRLRGRALLGRHGHLIGLDARKIERAEWYFVHHGMKTVFLARFVALLRILGSVVAGIARMPFATFSMMNLAGGVLWAVTFTALGYLFGENLPLLERHLKQVSLGIAAIALVGLAVYLVRRRRRERAAAATRASSGSSS